MRQILADLAERGYDSGVSIEPHLAAIIHTGKAADSATQLYDSYVEYGRRLAALVKDVTPANV